MQAGVSAVVPLLAEPASGREPAPLEATRPIPASGALRAEPLQNGSAPTEASFFCWLVVGIDSHDPRFGVGGRLIGIGSRARRRRVRLRATWWDLVSVNRAAVGLLVLTAVARFVASLRVRAPWIAPDEMIYALSGRGFWQTGQLQLLGLRAPFYGFYPLLAGPPLALSGPNTGLVVLQASQAVLVSLTGAVVFAWTREIVGARWGFAGAAMAIASPELARSGLIMTEAVFLPAVTFALWRLYVALQRPTPRVQALVGCAMTIVAAIRFQGLMLILVVVGALFSDVSPSAAPGIAVAFLVRRSL